MRGAAVIVSAAAAWILVTGALPHFDVSRPRVDARLVLFAIAGFIVGFVLALGMSGVPSVAVAVGCLGATVPVAMDRRRVRKLRHERLGRWPHILTQVRSSLSGGSTLVDALVDALDRAGGDFSTMAATIRTGTTFGDGFSSTVARIRSEVDDPTTDRIFVTLDVAHRSGGTRVGAIVGILARSVADEIRVQRAHDAAMTEQRLTVNVALIAPWVMLMLMVMTNPQAAASFTTPQGVGVICAGGVATGAGWLLAMRTARLSQPSGVFR